MPARPAPAGPRPAMPRGLWLLLATVLFMHLADYLVIPLLPVVLRIDRGLAVARVGMILGVSSLSYLTGSLIGGGLGDRFGRRRVMAAGAALRAAGLLGLGGLDSFALLAGAAVLSGAGSGFFAPGLKAAIAVVATGPARTMAFSLRGIAAHVGVGSAGLVAALVLALRGTWLFGIAAAIHLLLGLLAWRYLGDECENRGQDADCPRVGAGLRAGALRHRTFLAFGAAAFLVWALYSQLALALPLRAAAVLPNPRAIGLVWTLNSVLVIALQTPVTRWVIGRLHPMVAMAAGTVLLGGGVAGLGLATDYRSLALAAAIFVLGEMLVMPTYDSIVSHLAPPGQVGLYFGLANFLSGIGEGTGNFVGGAWLERAQRAASPALWLAYVLLAAAVASGLAALRFWAPLRQRLRPRR